MVSTDIIVPITDPNRGLVNTQKLAEHLTTFGGEGEFSPDDCVKTLADKGFVLTGDGWFACEEITLEFLDASEIMAVRQIV